MHRFAYNKDGSCFSVDQMELQGGQDMNLYWQKI